eukprot:TRINITY_DN8585_c0_g1_i1.p1 TRINITY_DN8585_c0_g1~~TRINITY_DN8585_c0_g1_i1.p1  ORF type:complete len:215 (-),score=55.98 TRINITY_DN8585_c0_g1_i1:148-792(-)
MEILDGDNGLFDSMGRKGQRDLCQFVPFNKYMHNTMLLSQEVLAELPDQLVEYKRLVGQRPNPPKTLNLNDIILPPDFGKATMNFGQNLAQAFGLPKVLNPGGQQGGPGGPPGASPENQGGFQPQGPSPGGYPGPSPSSFAGQAGMPQNVQNVFQHHVGGFIPGGNQQGPPIQGMSPQGYQQPGYPQGPGYSGYPPGFQGGQNQYGYPPPPSGR